MWLTLPERLLDNFISFFKLVPAAIGIDRGNNCLLSLVRNRQGFTLLEMALVLVIIGILAGGGVSLMKTLTERRSRNETIDYLKQAKAALISFGNINGRLPSADTDGDGNENSGASAGDLPYQTLKIAPADPNKRTVRYALNTNLDANRTTSCSALRTGLAGGPLVVDADGAAASFQIAAVLASAGTSDADSDGNVFDDITSGVHQGDNRDGNPNYLRHPPTDVFDDLVVYLGEHELYGEICGKPVLAVSNTTLPQVYVFDISQGIDIGIVSNGDTESYDIVSGTQIVLMDSPLGIGSVVGSTPLTPIVLAGSGRAVTIP